MNTPAGYECVARYCDQCGKNLPPAVTEAIKRWAVAVGVAAQAEYDLKTRRSAVGREEAGRLEEQAQTAAEEAKHAEERLEAALAGFVDRVALSRLLPTKSAGRAS